jgi:hypothetical protein
MSLSRSNGRKRQAVALVVHRDDASGTNKRDAARQERHEQIVAREQVERSLDEARAMIQTLEIQLVRERIAKGRRSAGPPIAVGSRAPILGGSPRPTTGGAGA